MIAFTVISSGCGRTNASDYYPAIARAAHVSGTVNLLVSYDLSGSAEKVRMVSGPPMLESSAIAYVETHIDASEAGRERAIQIRYQLDGCDDLPPIEKPDTIICAETQEPNI